MGIQPVKPPKPSGRKVAVVGSGPAGLTAAADLAKMGHAVTIFEALHVAGGVLMYGIPEFRLPKEIVQGEVNYVASLGVEIKLDSVVGKLVTIDELLKDGYNAVFLGTGAGLPMFLNCPGENLNGIYSANEFLTRVNLMKAYQFPDYDTPVRIGRRVAVFGGGNVAMDSARCALRLGAEEVYIIYRRSEVELPARREEVENAKEEGIIFKLLTNPKQFIGDEQNNVCQVECHEMELGEPDESGRRRPIVKEGSEFKIDIDVAIVALGTTPNPLIAQTTPGLETTKRGTVVADEDAGQTRKDKVWAGGDIVTGSATVISAMGAGKRAAADIDEYLKG
jgi:glutamate synthase (NADPH/NADH) small chain